MNIQKIKNSILIIITLLFLGGFVLESAGAVECKLGFTEYSGVCFPDDTGLSETPVKNIVVNVMQWLLGIFGFIALIAFAISGIQYLTATGNENAIETAKRNMKWSIVGVIVGLGGLVIIWAIDTALNAFYYI